MDTSSNVNNTSNDNVQMEKKLFYKMRFIFKAVESGKRKKKRDDSYIFSKKHENRREVFRPEYLENFIDENMNLNN